MISISWLLAAPVLLLALVGLAALAFAGVCAVQSMAFNRRVASYRSEVGRRFAKGGWRYALHMARANEG